MTAYGYVYIYIYGCIWIDFDARDLLHAAAQTPRDHVMKCSVAQGISMNSVGLVQIWVNYYSSLTWIKAIWGWLPYSQWGCGEVVIIYKEDRSCSFSCASCAANRLSSKSTAWIEFCGPCHIRNFNMDIDFFGFGTFWKIQHENSGSFSGVSALLDLFACSTLDFNQQKNILLDASMKYLSLSTITIYLSWYSLATDTAPLPPHSGHHLQELGNVLARQECPEYGSWFSQKFLDTLW